MQPRSLTAKTLLLAFGKILAAFATIGITAILARLLTIQDYATHKQALMIYALVAPPLMLGLPKALYFFLPGEKERPRAVLLENICLLVGGGLVFGLALIFGAGDFFARHFRNPALVDVIPMIAVYGVCMLPLAASATPARSHWHPQAPHCSTRNDLYPGRNGLEPRSCASKTGGGAAKGGEG